MVGIVDADLPENDKLVKKYQVKSFPMIFMLTQSNDYKGTIYRGEATAEAYASALRGFAGFSAMQLANTEVLLQRAHVLMESFVFGLFEEKGELYQEFKNASEHLRYIRFYYLLGRKEKDILPNATQENATKRENFIYIIQNPFFAKEELSSQMVPYIKTPNMSLDAFIVKNFANGVEICTQQTIKTYQIRRQNYLALFMDIYDNLNVTKSIGQQLMELANKYTKPLKMCISHYEETGITADLLGLKIGEAAVFDHNKTAHMMKEVFIEKDGDIGKLKVKELDNWIQKYFKREVPAVNLIERMKTMQKEMHERQMSKNQTSSEKEPKKPVKKVDL